MADKRLFLHVGTNKAASTSLQQFFLYFNALDTQHHYLADEYRLGEDVSQSYRESERMLRVIKQRLMRKIEESPRDNIIISSENFWSPIFNGNFAVSTEIIERIKELFDFIPTRILIVFRRQDTLLESGYLWRLKAVMNYRDDFKTFLESRDPEAYDWFRIVKYWEKIMGRENISVIPFELLKHDKPLFVRQLMRFLSIQVPDDFDIDLPRSNMGINMDGVNYVLGLPKTTKSKEEQKLLRAYLDTHFPITKGEKPTFFTPVERAAFLEQFHAANRMLLRQYGYDETLWEL